MTIPHLAIHFNRQVNEGNKLSKQKDMLPVLTRLADGQEWKVALDENFLLVYNADFEPGKTYKVVLDID